METTTAETLAQATTDFSIFALFGHADFFVKCIMLLLLAMSVAAWAIWIAKAKKFRNLRKKASRFEEAFWGEEGLEELYADTTPDEADHPMAKVYVLGLREGERLSKNKKIKALNPVDRLRQLINATMIRELEKMESFLPTLATIGSTAPFIGLLGTVWGIMNSFQSIGASKNTSLAVVAPGIAEALLATALGLFAAIPAVVAYNRLSSELGRYANRMEAFVAEYLSILEAEMEGSSDGPKLFGNKKAS